MIFFFFFNDTATTEIYTLSLHDALPICESVAEYIANRYPKAADFLDVDDEINPVPGTRAPLFQIGLLLKGGNKEKSLSLVTNPFYHAWRAGAIADRKSTRLNSSHW